MTPMRIAKVLALTALVGASVSCGDLVRQGRSPVYLVIDEMSTDNGNFLLSDVASDSGSIVDDVGTVVLRAEMKNIGSTTNPVTPSTNNDVTINRVHISYRRADGHNVGGVDVPYAFDSAVTGTVGVDSQITLTFELVRHVAKAESPLVELTRDGAGVITTLADVTFYGRDQVGNEVSVTGTIQVNFGDFAG